MSLYKIQNDPFLGPYVGHSEPKTLFAVFKMPIEIEKSIHMWVIVALRVRQNTCAQC